MDKVIVLGIGNILLSDEGFGVRVIEKLQSELQIPENVLVVDGGTLGYDLLRILAGTQKLIIVDAITGGKEPGTIYHFKNDEVKSYYRQKVSLHQLGIQEVLAMMEISGQSIPEIAVFGLEPASLEIGLTLSATATAVINTVAEQVLEQLKAWDIPVASLA